ncbi:hypothetical protein NDA12_004968 [Ustilago hordei]|nr:hypothetical protein NDA12_004968 [Ustilago hordei]
MCGITALLLSSVEQSAAPEINEALSLLQHRGQDAAGIVTCGNKGRFYQCKANGMVRDVLDVNAIARLQGNMGVGHVRYPTAGSSAHSEAQPFYVNSPYGITFAHNGNLINTDELRRFLDADAHRHINTDSDSEVLLNIFANNLQKTGKFRINEEDIFTAIRDLMKQCKGGYTCIAMLAGFGIIAFRDPNGIRPLGICSRPSSSAESAEVEGHGKDYCFTSESVVCDALGFEDFEDIKAGEAVIITKHAVSHSVIDGVSVYRSRMAMGDKLADEVRRQLEATGMSIDVVIPVPDTSRVAALQLAQNLGVPYREGFVKNRYVGRTFIMPGQSVRRKNVRRKLNAMALEFSGKNVLIVDDSIVRGTTSKEIIQMARDAGAKKVIMASCAPPIRYSNVYGIDMPSRQELVAYGRTVEQIAEYIQADMVIYQTLEDLIDSVKQFNPDLKKFDCSVFDGHYVTGGVDAEYIAHLEHLRSENAKAKKAATNIPVISENQKKIYASRASPAASSVAGGPMDGANDEKMASDPSGAVVNGAAANANGTNGNRKRRLNAEEEEEEEEKQQQQQQHNVGCSGPMNGADDIGLFNSWTR